MGSEASKSRRSFLSVLTGLGGAYIGLVMAKPAVSYVVDPLLRAGGKKGRWLRVAKLDALDEAQPLAFPIVGEQVDAWTRQPNVRLGMVWLRKKGDKVMALTAECPHLGCKVGYDKDKKHFGCPCHESAFSEDGEKIGGPAPRSMDPLEARVVEGQVEVRFVRFRAQIKERQEVG
ncbi:MAG: ubiquinol-cytochrome c reductase iron-sulfur subunit [Polyangiales bacterium]